MVCLLRFYGCCSVVIFAVIAAVAMEREEGGCKGEWREERSQEERGRPV